VAGAIPRKNFSTATAAERRPFARDFQARAGGEVDMHPRRGGWRARAWMAHFTGAAWDRRAAAGGASWSLYAASAVVGSSGPSATMATSAEVRAARAGLALVPDLDVHAAATLLRNFGSRGATRMTPLDVAVDDVRHCCASARESSPNNFLCASFGNSSDRRHERRLRANRPTKTRPAGRASIVPRTDARP